MSAHYHLPGLFEFYELYKIFLPLYRENPEYFYNGCDIASIYGSPQDCLWGGGRTGFGEADASDVFDLMKEYNISSRLTFSNSLLTEEHLADKKCNSLCKLLLELSALSKALPNLVVSPSICIVIPLILLENIKIKYIIKLI